MSTREFLAFLSGQVRQKYAADLFIHCISKSDVYHKIERIFDVSIVVILRISSQEVRSNCCSGSRKTGQSQFRFSASQTGHCFGPSGTTFDICFVLQNDFVFTTKYYFNRAIDMFSSCLSFESKTFSKQAAVGRAADRQTTRHRD